MTFSIAQFHAVLQQAKQTTSNESDPLRILSLIDLTSLNSDDDEDRIRSLCHQSSTEYGSVAAVCVYLTFVPLSKQLLQETAVKIATVSNFPHGTELIEKVSREIEKATDNGADEVDVVWPYADYLSGREEEVGKFVNACSVACGGHAHLKIIMETGLFPDVEKIYHASRLIIDAGADFLKTSTGKVEVNATPEAAAAMLFAIRDSGEHIGFKAAGGIRTVQQATQYLNLATQIMGSEWITPDTFRLGASSLLNEVLSECKDIST